jgi:hypothetical protein
MYFGRMLRVALIAGTAAASAAVVTTVRPHLAQADEHEHEHGREHGRNEHEHGEHEHNRGHEHNGVWPGYGYGSDYGNYGRHDDWWRHRGGGPGYIPPGLGQVFGWPGFGQGYDNYGQPGYDNGYDNGYDQDQGQPGYDDGNDQDQGQPDYE